MDNNSIYQSGFVARFSLKGGRSPAYHELDAETIENAIAETRRIYEDQYSTYEVFFIVICTIAQEIEPHPWQKEREEREEQERMAEIERRERVEYAQIRDRYELLHKKYG